MTHILLFADGGSRGNPGPAASGSVGYDITEFKLVDEKNLSDNFLENITSNKSPDFTKSEFLGNATNNQAEWYGLILGLTKTVEIYGSQVILSVCLDSELVVKQVQGIYKVKHPQLIPYFTQAKNLLRNFHKFNIQHIYRKYNSTADALVNRVLDSSKS